MQTRYKEEIFYNEGGETLAQVAQRGGRCPIPGNIQDPNSNNKWEDAEESHHECTGGLIIQFSFETAKRRNEIHSSGCIVQEVNPICFAGGSCWEGPSQLIEEARKLRHKEGKHFAQGIEEDLRQGNLGRGEAVPTCLVFQRLAEAMPDLKGWIEPLRAFRGQGRARVVVVQPYGEATLPVLAEVLPTSLDDKAASSCRHNLGAGRPKIGPSDSNLSISENTFGSEGLHLLQFADGCSAQRAQKRCMSGQNGWERTGNRIAAIWTPVFKIQDPGFSKKPVLIRPSKLVLAYAERQESCTGGHVRVERKISRKILLQRDGRVLPLRLCQGAVRPFQRQRGLREVWHPSLATRPPAQMNANDPVRGCII
ncbi:hypothetical protein QYF61_009199, partial [Mycteria americana]